MTFCNYRGTTADGTGRGSVCGYRESPCAHVTCCECKRRPRAGEEVVLEPGICEKRHDHGATPCEPGPDSWLCPECLARPQRSPYDSQLAAMEARYDY